MTISSLYARPNKRGNGFCAWIVGQPNDHLMDYRGCNFKELRVPGVGAAWCIETLADLVRAVYPTRADLQRVVLSRTGSYHPDLTPTQWKEAGYQDLEPWPR